MAASELMGLITCPMCGNENATVQKMVTGSRKNRLYFRCYESVGSFVMRCGTIQCIGQTGQDFISKNMRPVSAQVPKNPSKPKPARAIAQKPAIAPEAVPAEPSPVEPEPAIAPEPIPPENEPKPTTGDEPAPAPVKKSLWKILRENPNG